MSPQRQSYAATLRRLLIGALPSTNSSEGRAARAADPGGSSEGYRGDSSDKSGWRGLGKWRVAWQNILSRVGVALRGSARNARECTPPLVWPVAQARAAT
eukprot:15483146-Alexandrium_andersonii.AAC.1